MGGAGDVRRLRTPGGGRLCWIGGRLGVGVQQQGTGVVTASPCSTTQSVTGSTGNPTEAHTVGLRPVQPGWVDPTGDCAGGCGPPSCPAGQSSSSAGSAVGCHSRGDKGGDKGLVSQIRWPSPRVPTDGTARPLTTDQKSKEPNMNNVKTQQCDRPALGTNSAKELP